MIDWKWSIFPIGFKEECKLNKLSNFIHQLRQKSIKTRERLFKMQNGKNSEKISEFIKINFNHEFCLHCLFNNDEYNVEDFYHLFIDCPKSKEINNEIFDKINSFSKFFFRKDFPKDLIWFNYGSNQPENRPNFPNFDLELGAIGIIPKNLFERLSILNPSIQLRNKFLKAALKVIAYTNIKKVKEHR